MYIVTRNQPNGSELGKEKRRNYLQSFNPLVIISFRVKKIILTLSNVVDIASVRLKVQTLGDLYHKKCFVC